MDITKGRHLLVERLLPGIHVVRFAHAQVGELLYDEKKIASLWQELQTNILADMGEGETLILNLGLVDPFPTPFYRCLLKVRKVILALQAKLILCNLSPALLETFQIILATRLFQIVDTEGEAIYFANPGKN